MRQVRLTAGIGSSASFRWGATRARNGTIAIAMSTSDGRMTFRQAAAQRPVAKTTPHPDRDCMSPTQAAPGRPRMRRGLRRYRTPYGASTGFRRAYRQECRTDDEPPRLDDGRAQLTMRACSSHTLRNMVRQTGSSLNGRSLMALSCAMLRQRRVRPISGDPAPCEKLFFRRCKHCCFCC
jgi:hypothetical protein